MILGLFTLIFSLFGICLRSPFSGLVMKTWSLCLPPILSTLSPAKREGHESVYHHFIAPLLIFTLYFYVYYILFCFTCFCSLRVTSKRCALLHLHSMLWHLVTRYCAWAVVLSLSPGFQFTKHHKCVNRLWKERRFAFAVSFLLIKTRLNCTLFWLAFMLIRRNQGAKNAFLSRRFFIFCLLGGSNL